MQNIENCEIYRFNLLIAVCLCNKVMNSNQICCYFNFVSLCIPDPFPSTFSTIQIDENMLQFMQHTTTTVGCAIKITVHFIVSGIVLPSIFVHLQTVIDVILWRCIHLIAKYCLMLIQKYFLKYFTSQNWHNDAVRCNDLMENMFDEIIKWIQKDSINQRREKLI